MKPFLIAGLAIIGIFILFIGGIFLYFTNLDFVGQKDPETVKQNAARFNKELLRAHFFSKNEICDMTLSDSTNIQLTVGNNKTDYIILRKYTMDGDTIIIKNSTDDNKFETLEIVKMIPSQKMLLDGNRILFDYNLKDKKFNPAKFMEIEMNALR